MIRLAHFEDAVHCLTSVLHYAPLNAQAYYLRVKSFMCLSEYQIALGDLTRTKELLAKPGNETQAQYVEELISDLQALKRNDEEQTHEQRLSQFQKA